MTDGRRLSWDGMMQVSPDRLNEHSFIPIRVFTERDELFSHLAGFIMDMIKRNNSKGRLTRIGWPVGPKRHIPWLLKITHDEEVSWANTVNFQVDEWLDWRGRLLPKDHPFNLQSYLRRELFDNIQPALRPEESRMFFLDPCALDRCDEKLDEYGGLDLFLGGFGFTGHVAYNEPPTSRWIEITNEQFCTARTRIVPTNDETFIMHAHRSTGGNTRAIPSMAITIGMKDILAAREIRLVSDGGQWKQTILRVMCMHEPTVRYPCTLVQGHPGAEVLVDARTAQCPCPDFVG